MRAEQLTSTLVNRNTFYNVQSYNQTAAKNNSSPRSSGRSDTNEMSPMRRVASMIEALQKQKRNILDARRELVSSNSKAGKDISEIKTQLDAYNELLNSIDEQVAKAVSDLAVEEADKLKELQQKLEEKLSESKEQEPKTEEEIFADKMGNIAEADAELDAMKEAASLKRMASNKATILKSEIEFDESLSNGIPAASKRADLVNLNKFINEQGRDFSRAVRHTNSIISKNQEHEAPVKDEDKDGIEDNPVGEDTAAPDTESKETVPEDTE